MPAIGEEVGREFIALFLFDAKGGLLEAKIDDLGVRQQVDPNHARALLELRLSELGEVFLCNIKVAPFRLERFDTEFGLIPREPEDEDDHWWVILEPGNYMAFHPPWNGDYDT